MPDEETLALWVDDELEGGKLAGVEAWAAGEIEWLERREEARAWKRQIQAVLPAGEEVPYAEFFNSRIMREIREPAELPVMVAAGGGRTWGWFMPFAAAAGVLFGIWIGKGIPEGSGAAFALSAAEVPVLYTPERGVSAEHVPSEGATVIVLAGVAALSDDWEIPETASIRTEGENTASSLLR